MKKMLVILFVVVFSFPVLGQQAIEGTSINLGNIYTTDSDIIEGHNIVFVNDSIEFYLENSQTRHILGLDQVTEVLKYDGNYSSTGGYVGAIVGGIVSAAIYIAGGTTKRTTSSQFYLSLLSAVGCVAAGALIGSLIEDWETVYSKSTAFLKNFNIKQNKLSGLAVSYKVYF